MHPLAAYAAAHDALAAARRRALSWLRDEARRLSAEWRRLGDASRTAYAASLCGRGDADEAIRLLLEARKAWQALVAAVKALRRVEAQRAL